MDYTKPEDTAKKVMRRIFPDASDEQYEEAAQFIVQVADITAKSVITFFTRE